MLHSYSDLITNSSSITFLIDPNNTDKMKESIRKAADRMCEEILQNMENGNNNMLMLTSAQEALLDDIDYMLQDILKPGDLEKVKTILEEKYPNGIFQFRVASSDYDTPISMFAYEILDWDSDIGQIDYDDLVAEITSKLGYQ